MAWLVMDQFEESAFGADQALPLTGMIWRETRIIENKQLNISTRRMATRLLGCKLQL